MYMYDIKKMKRKMGENKKVHEVERKDEKNDTH